MEETESQIDQQMDYQPELKDTYQVIYHLYNKSTGNLVNACFVEYQEYSGTIQHDNNGLVFQQYFHEFTKHPEDDNYNANIFYRIVQVWKCGEEYYLERKQKINERLEELVQEELLNEKFKML